MHHCSLMLPRNKPAVGTWQVLDGAAVEAGQQSISAEMLCDVGHSAQ